MDAIVVAILILFDGTSFDGWAHTGPGYFELVSEEKAMVSRGGMGMLYYCDRKFKDFELTLEWKVSKPEDNSGVFVRFPNLPKKDRGADAEGNNLNGPWAAVNEGYEIQICDVDPPDRRTGALYSFFPSTDVPTKEVGEWNEMKIFAVGQHYGVLVNGKQVGDYKGSRATEGYIGLQNHGKNDEVWFRNIRIRPLDEETGTTATDKK